MIRRLGVFALAVLIALAIPFSVPALPANAQPSGDPVLDACFALTAHQLDPNGANFSFCQPPVGVKVGQTYGLRVVVWNKRVDQQVHFTVRLLHTPQHPEHEQVVPTVGEVKPCADYTMCRNWEVTLEPTQQAVLFFNITPQARGFYDTQATAVVTYLGANQTAALGGWVYRIPVN